MSPSQKAELVQDITRVIANEKHNAYADGYNAGKLQGAVEAANHGKVSAVLAELARRLTALEQWSKLADEKGAALADVRNLRDEHKPILDGLAVRAVELENRTNGLAESLDNLNGELKLTEAGLGALERKVEQMEASAQAVPASVSETEAFSRWSSQPWSGDLEHLNKFFGEATGDTHRNASAAMEAGFRAGFRAARG